MPFCLKIKFPNNNKVPKMKELSIVSNIKDDDNISNNNSSSFLRTKIKFSRIPYS